MHLTKSDLETIEFALRAAKFSAPQDSLEWTEYEKLRQRIYNEIYLDKPLQSTAFRNQKQQQQQAFGH